MEATQYERAVLATSFGPCWLSRNFGAVHSHCDMEIVLAHFWIFVTFQYGIRKKQGRIAEL
jgi:hypothetical protein